MGTVSGEFIAPFPAALDDERESSARLGVDRDGRAKSVPIENIENAENADAISVFAL